MRRQEQMASGHRPLHWRSVCWRSARPWRSLCWRFARPWRSLCWRFARPWMSLCWRFARPTWSWRRTSGPSPWPRASSYGGGGHGGLHGCLHGHGSNPCHCPHVDTLIEDLAARKAIARTAGDDPWARARRPAASPEPNDHGAAAAHTDEHTGEAPRDSPAGTDRQWPLKMVGLLGAINFKD